MERWVEIWDFPGYSVSDHGRVRNDRSGRILAMLRNQFGSIHVGLMRDGIQHKRSLARLVATAFLPKNTLEDYFNTPIHLDVDHENNHYQNLDWRPRWFAIVYHDQFKDRPLIGNPIRDVDTEEVFRDSWDACMKHGLLDKQVFRSVVDGIQVFPTYQRFELVE